MNDMSAMTKFSAKKLTTNQCREYYNVRVSRLKVKLGDNYLV